MGKELSYDGEPSRRGGKKCVPLALFRLVTVREMNRGNDVFIRIWTLREFATIDDRL